jgi:hypothetical protein
MKRAFATTLFLVIPLTLSVQAFAQSESRNDLLRQIETKRTELSALETKFLAPSDEDRAVYTEFLRQPDTGLFRLLPREIYESDTYKSNRKKTLTIRGGGSYYSFTRLSHEYDYGTDIGLEQGYLKVGFAGADYGMLAKLSDVPLEDLTTEHPSVLFLSTYEAVTEEPQARLEQRRFGTGTTIDGLLYKERLPVEVGATYILRSINYSDSDVLVAFRVIRKDTDGSIVIAWKLLKKYSVPKLARNN